MKNFIYWISTVLISACMLFGAVACLDHQPKMMATFTSLGYPGYFPNLLGIFEILGVIALVSPGFPILKEWAYAGFTFTFISAFVSHLATSHAMPALMPLIASILLAASYFTRPANRRPRYSNSLAGKFDQVEENGPPSAAISLFLRRAIEQARSAARERKSPSIRLY